MSIRVKSRRRLLQLTVTMGLFAVVGVGAYMLRLRQIESQLSRSRAEGAQAFQEGNYEVALHKIGTYVQRHPEDADALYQYAQAREQVPMANGKHISDAISIYRQYRGLRPEDTEARRKLLNLYADRGFNKEALDVAEEILAHVPQDPAALRAKARSLARQRQFDEALLVAESYRKLVPDDLEIHRLTLEVMLAQQMPSKDIVAYASDRLAEHPGDARFELLLSIAYAIGGDQAKAEEFVRLAAPDGPDKDPVFIKALVGQLEALQLFDESLQVLDRAADAGGPEIGRLYVTRLWQSKRPQQVVDRLKGLDPADNGADSELLALRAIALFELGRAAEANVILDALARRFDSTAEAWSLVLKAEHAQPPLPSKDVISACKRALGNSPNNAHFHNALAEAYAAVGESDLALVHWQQAARLAPSWAAPAAKLAEACLAASRLMDAFAAGVAAKQRAPTDAHSLLSYALVLTTIVNLESRNPGADALARRAELRVLASKIEALDPQNDTVLVMRVVADAASEKKDDATAAIQGALESNVLLSETTLLRLAGVSRDHSLGLEQVCYERCQALHGLTPALATVRARSLLSAGKGAEGRALFEGAMNSVKKPGDDKGWRGAWASYLELSGDAAAAKATIIALADALPDDAQIQGAALRSSAAQSDLEFAKRAIERLRAATGEDAVRWRVARARVLLQEAEKKQQAEPTSGVPQEVTQAAAVLGEVTRSVPELVEPRVLLAACLERLGNRRDAIDQLTAVVNQQSNITGAALELARMLQAEGDAPGAKTYLDRVTGDRAATSQQRLSAAALLAQTGDTPKAIAVLEQSPGGEPLPPTVFLAELYRRNGDVAKAKDTCQKLLSNAADPGTIGLFADILATEGQTEQAEQVLSKLDQATAPAPQKELIRGRHYLTHGERAKALEQFAAATHAAPTNAIAWRFLVKHHLVGGDLSAALAAVDAAAKQKVQDPGLQALRRVAAVLPAGAEANAMLPLVAGVLDAPADEQAVIEVLRCVDDAKKNPSADGLLAQVRDIANRTPKALVVQNVAARSSVSLGGRSGAEEGLAIATRAMQNFPSAAEPAEIAATALASLSRWDEVVGMATQWKQRSPSAAGADLIIATAHLALKRPQRALAVLEPYVAKGRSAPDGEVLEKPVVTQATVLYAQTLVAAGKVPDAELLLASRIKRSPEYRMAWISIAARQLPDHAAAARWLDMVENSVAQPAFAEQAALTEAWLVLAVRSSVTEHRDRSRKMLGALSKRTLESSESKPDELVGVGLLCEASGDRATAESAYNRALSKDPAHPVALNNLAMILCDRGEIVVAEKFARQAAARDHPRRASFYDTLATVQAKARQGVEAAKSIKAALELDPDNVGFQIHQAKIFADSGEDVKAKDALDAVPVRPEDPRLSNTDRERLKSLRDKFASRS